MLASKNKNVLVIQALKFYFDYLDLKIAKKRSIERNKSISLSQMRELSNESV